MPETAPNSTDPRLLRKVKANDPKAKNDVVAWIGPLINHWCRRVTLQDREEVIQEVFQQIFSSIGGFKDRPGGSFRGWLKTITQHKILDLVRGREKGPQARGGDVAYRQLLEQVMQEVGQEDDNDADILLWTALRLVQGDFKKHVWDAFWLTTVENFTAAHAGDKLKMTANAVGQAKQRVRRRLQEVYGQMLS